MSNDEPMTEMTAAGETEQDLIAAENTREFVTLEIGDQLFGVEVTSIHDVFQPQSITPVPLSPPEIVGVLNLRGRIVTAVDARKRIGMDADTDGSKPRMAVGVEKNSESYGLLVDAVDEVLRLSDAEFEENPRNLDPRLAAVSQGVYRLEGRLMMVMDVEQMLEFDTLSVAA